MTDWAAELDLRLFRAMSLAAEAQVGRVATILHAARTGAPGDCLIARPALASLAQRYEEMALFVYEARDALCSLRTEAGFPTGTCSAAGVSAASELELAHNLAHSIVWLAARTIGRDDSWLDDGLPAAERWRAFNLSAAAMSDFDPSDLRARITNERVRILALIEHPPATPPAAPLSPDCSKEFVVWRGKQVYQVAAHRPVTLSESEHDVLQAFLKSGSGCLTGPELTAACRENPSSAPVEDPARVLRKLASATRHKGVFSAVIDLPGRKGNGGYHVRIRDESHKQEVAT